MAFCFPSPLVESIIIIKRERGEKKRGKKGVVGIRKGTPGEKERGEKKRERERERGRNVAEVGVTGLCVAWA